MNSREYRKLYKVPFWTPVYHGQIEGYSMINIRPCPGCKRNDTASNIREGYGILHIYCGRCGTDFWS